MMLTRCPGCATTFRVTPEQLKARQGKVRCGKCQAVFNALETLDEEAPAQSIWREPPAQPIAAAPVPEVAPAPVIEPSPPEEAPTPEPALESSQSGEIAVAEPEAEIQPPRDSAPVPEPMAAPDARAPIGAGAGTRCRARGDAAVATRAGTAVARGGAAPAPCLAMAAGQPVRAVPPDTTGGGVLSHRVGGAGARGQTGAGGNLQPRRLPGRTTAQDRPDRHRDIRSHSRQGQIRRPATRRQPAQPGSLRPGLASSGSHAHRYRRPRRCCVARSRRPSICRASHRRPMASRRPASSPFN